MTQDKLAMDRIDTFDISRKELKKKRQESKYGHLIQ